MAAVYPTHARKAHPAPDYGQREKWAARSRLRKRMDASGLFYARALAIEREAHTRYVELGVRVTDYGYDRVARLFGRLAGQAAEHAFQLSKKCEEMLIPLYAAYDYAWFDCGAPVPEARAFIYQMMTPRLALQIALRAEERGKAYFDQVHAESRHADVRKLAAEFARYKATQATCIEEALAHLPEPFRPTEQMPGDPTLEQLV